LVYCNLATDWRDGIVATALAILTLPIRAIVIGKARVIEGDTVEIAIERIRLQGIDAPESRRVDTRHADTT